MTENDVCPVCKKEIPERGWILGSKPTSYDSVYYHKFCYENLSFDPRFENRPVDKDHPGYRSE